MCHNLSKIVNLHMFCVHFCNLYKQRLGDKESMFVANSCIHKTMVSIS